MKKMPKLAKKDIAIIVLILIILVLVIFMFFNQNKDLNSNDKNSNDIKENIEQNKRILHYQNLRVYQQQKIYDFVKENFPI